MQTGKCSAGRVRFFWICNGMGVSFLMNLKIFAANFSNYTNF
jgi:hypothetical protein